MTTSAALLLALLSAMPLIDAQVPTGPNAPIIDMAEVTGLSTDRLSADLRRDIGALAGQPFDRARVDSLAARIETEHPEVVAAARDVLRPDGRVRVVFLVARINDDTSLASNINARYIVERVEITGIAETEISQKLRDDVQALVGSRLDPGRADHLGRRLHDEQPDYDVVRTVSRGSEAGRILVTFALTRTERPWIPWAAAPAKLLYVQDQGWSGRVNIVANGKREQFLFGLVGWDSDRLVEKDSGFLFRFEDRQAGTKRLGVSFEISKYQVSWEDATLAVLEGTPELPQAYDTLTTAQPVLTFAISPQLRIAAGISTSELTPLSGAESQTANAGVFSIQYGRTWEPAHGASSDPSEGPRHQLTASYLLRTGRTGLGSDLVYTRHFGEARYHYERDRSEFTAGFFAGGLTGAAPLFERFSLGDSLSLRGWNKFDIVPAGATRVVYQSVEYAYRHVGTFLDAGSSWETGQDATLRLSAGIGYQNGNVFVTLAVPLDADRVRPKFMFGARF